MSLANAATAAEFDSLVSAAPLARSPATKWSFLWSVLTQPPLPPRAPTGSRPLLGALVSSLPRHGRSHDTACVLNSYSHLLPGVGPVNECRHTHAGP